MARRNRLGCGSRPLKYIISCSDTLDIVSVSVAPSDSWLSDFL